MLYRSAAQPCATPTFKHIYGDKLARALKAGKLSASYRALLAHDLATGAVAIRLSRKQAIALTHANATYVTGPRPPLLERAAYTIREFCDAHRISKSPYYNLRKQGLGPDEARVLDRVIITMEAAARWRKARERTTSRPPNRTAIGKILKRKYAGAVHLDASSIFSVPTLEAFRATRRPPERHSGHK